MHSKGRASRPFCFFFKTKKTKKVRHEQVRGASADAVLERRRRARGLPTTKAARCLWCWCRPCARKRAPWRLPVCARPRRGLRPHHRRGGCPVAAGTGCVSRPRLHRPDAASRRTRESLSPRRRLPPTSAILSAPPCTAVRVPARSASVHGSPPTSRGPDPLSGYNQTLARFIGHEETS